MLCGPSTVQVLCTRPFLVSRRVGFPCASNESFRGLCLLHEEEVPGPSPLLLSYICGPLFLRGDFRNCFAPSLEFPVSLPLPSGGSHAVGMLWEELRTLFFACLGKSAFPLRLNTGFGSKMVCRVLGLEAVVCKAVLVYILYIFDAPVSLAS